MSFVGHDDKASFRSSFRACDPNTPARDPTDFHHGLLRTGRASTALLLAEGVGLAAGEGGGLVLLELLELAVGGLSAGARDGAGVGSGTEYGDELPLVVLFAVVVRLQRYVFVFRSDADDSSAGYGWSLRAEGGGLTWLGSSLTATSLTATSRTAGLLDPRDARASTSLAARLLAAAPLLSKSGLLASSLLTRSWLAKTGLLTKSGLLTKRLWTETRLLTGSGLLPPILLVVLSRLAKA